MKNKIAITDFLQSKTIKERIIKMFDNEGKANNFIASVTSLVNTNPNLASVDKSTLLNACLTAVSLNLPINQNLSVAYVIPYKGKAQFQIGYKGFIQLAHRTKEYLTIHATDVRKGELRQQNRLTGDIDFEWVQNEKKRDKMKIIGYVSYFKLRNGFDKYLYMSNSQLKSHGLQYSQSLKKGYGLWKDNYEAMALKTVLKLLLSKYGIISTEIAKAIESDQGVIEDEGVVYVDNKEAENSQVGSNPKVNKKALENKRKEVFALGKEIGKSAQDVKHGIKEYFQVDSFNDLDFYQLDKFCDSMRKRKQMQEKQKKIYENVKKKVENNEEINRHDVLKALQGSGYLKKAKELIE